MRKSLFIGLTALLLASTCFEPIAHADSPPTKKMTADRPENHLREPFWNSKWMYGEALLFVQPTAAERPFARLAFTPNKTVALQSATGLIAYVEGQDYIVDAKTRTITLPPGSKIPFVTSAQLSPPPGSPNSMGGNIDGKNNLLWAEGHFFHDMEVEATYSHAKNEWNGYAPVVAKTNLSKTLALLKKKKTLQIVMLGDSISAGYNASAHVEAAPMMPPYAELVRSGLQAAYGSPVSLKNLAVAGKNAEWGLTQTDAVIAAKPDLVLLAFGMNDSGAFAPEAYIANIKKTIDTIHAQLPNTEFILVASMLPNSNWAAVRVDRFPLYRDALNGLTGPGIALADMTAVWTEMSARKAYLDLTGNGLNHPNDFGHRLYAQVILGLLAKK